MKSNIVRTRIAPSPTGEDLHIGNAYTALINYIVAKKQKGKFVVRIEDTDQTRLVAGSENKILESLKWLNIVPDEDPKTGGPYKPYRQSRRLSLYKKYAGELIEKNHAYYCFCTKEQLDQMRKIQISQKKPPMYDGGCKKFIGKKAKRMIEEGRPYVIRLNIPKSGTTKFNDLIRGEIAFENKLIDDQVLLKTDGYPTYHLAVVVDDHLMKISHIIRGEEWISSTPKHVLLYQYFGWELPKYAHMPLLRNPDKSKLSKRKNPVWVSWYKDEGYLSEALLNYLATLAWAHPSGKDIFTLREMTEVFDLSQIQTTAPVFDIEKLRWMNGEYIRSNKKLNIKNKIFDYFSGKYSKEMINKILPLVSERMKTLKEYEALADFFFARPKDYETYIDPANIEIAKKALESVKDNWKHNAMYEAMKSEIAKESVKGKRVFMDLRVKITGRKVGPPLFESLEILGFKETMERLKY